MGDADIGHHILEERLAVVVMAEIYLLVEHFVKQGPYGKSLLAERLALDPGNLLHFIIGNRTQGLELLLGLLYFPDSNFSFVFKCFLKIQCHNSQCLMILFHRPCPYTSHPCAENNSTQHNHHPEVNQDGRSR